jgi:hypothetical protein
MSQWVLNIATGMLIVGYLIHATSYFVVSMERFGIAMICFAIAMYYLFV